jgi:Ca2+-binding EF-hand superfamily protein
MLPALGALSFILDALQPSSSSKPSSSQSTGFSQTSTNPFDLTGNAATSQYSTPACGSGGCSQISPATMSALLAAQSQTSTAPTASPPTSRADALKDLFSLLDTNGDGQVSKAEFENTLGAGGTNLAQADDVFGKLDKNGDGAVSLRELTSALKGGGGKGHHHHRHVASSDGSRGAGNSSSTSGSNSDPLLQALSGASSTQVSNSDGSTTTSVTYADGSKVTTTTPPATKSSSGATSSYNFIEQLIQREAQAISSSAAAPLSVSV